MKKSLLLSLLLLFFTSLEAQPPGLDSLLNVLQTGTLSVEQQLETYDKICSRYTNYDLDKLVEYAEGGLELCEKAKDKSFAARFNNHLGVASMFKGEHDKAMPYYEKALDQALRSDDKLQQAIVYGSMGSSMNLQSRYEEALEYDMKALSLFEELGNKKQTILALVNIGSTHNAMFNTERSIYYFEKAETLANEINDKSGQMHASYYLGGIYRDKGDMDKSMEYNLQTVELSRELGNRQAEILSLQTLAYLYCRGPRDYAKAEECALESLRLAQESGRPRLVVAAKGLLSVIYLYQERFRECAVVSREAWEATDSTDMDHRSTLAANLTNAYIMLGERDKAVEFFQNYGRIMQAYNDQTFQQKISDMEIRYETEKKELRIDVLEKEKTFYIWLGIAGAVVLLLVVGLLLVRHRLARQRVRQLEQEKQLVATQALLEGETAERSRLARDLHDGLGGMLSVVKLNLKDMKGYSVMDGQDVERFDNALQMLDDSIGELRRVAHHMMPESLMRYGLKVSLEDFCRAIPGARFEYLGEDPRLDSRLEVLIYRCAYELVNNAVKHAGATSINVQLLVDNGLVSLTVHDNGRGFDPDSVVAGAGLDNIRTRVSAYNGRMTIHSSADSGTEISIEIEPA